MADSGGTVTKRVFTAAELRRLLAQQGALYTPRLREVSLVVELGLVERDVKKLKLIASLSAERYGPTFLLESFKQSDAALAVLLPHLGRQEFRRNKFWPYFAESIDLSYDQIEGSIQHDLGELFLESLRRHGLPVFEDVGHRFLDNILLHGGIPDYCLEDWFRLLDDGQRHVGADASAIATWAMGRFDSGGLAYVDMPVRRLLHHGRDFAVDLADRSLDLLADLRSTGEADAAALGLRSEYLSKANAVLHRDSTSRAPTPTAVRQSRPVLRLDPDRGQILVVLPEVADAEAHATWQVRLGDSVREVEPARLWGGDTLRFASVTVPVDHPVAQIGVGMPLVGEKYTLPVLDDPARPVLFFDDSGANIPAGVSLPAEMVWIVAPDETKHRIRIGETSNPSVDLGSPVGWTGWTLQEWDLSGERSVRIGSSVRAISGRGRARLVSRAQEVVDDVTIGGLPVLNTRPRILLPSDVSSEWSLIVTDAASGQVIAQRLIVGEDSHDPFEGFPAPILGRFAITVRGPLGRGFTRSVSIAEGLQVTADPAFRLFIPEGLSASAVDVRFDGGDIREIAAGKASAGRASVSKFSMHLGPRDSIRQLGLAAQGRRSDLLVAPAALAAATIDSRGASEWTHAPVSVVDDDIGKTTLLLRIGKDAAPTLCALSGRGEVQQVPPQTLRAGRNVAYDLRQLSDSVAMARVNQLVLGWGDHQVPVARIRPKVLATGFDVVGGRLVLSGATASDLEVVLWSTGAPLQPPVVLSVDESFSVQPPEGHPLAGRAVVSVRLRDDWVVQRVPRFPRRGSVMASAHSFVPSGASSWVSQLIAGQYQGGARVELTPRDLEEVWAALLVDDALSPSLRMAPAARSELSKALRSTPASAVSALAQLSLSRKKAARYLLSVGLAGVPTAAGVATDDDTVRTTLELSPVAAVLLYSGRMIGAVGDEELPIVVGKHLGLNAVTFLRTGRDEDAGAGRFGDEFTRLQLLARHSQDQLDDLLSAMEMTPKGLLHEDSRSLAASVIIRRLETPELRSLARDARHVVLGVRAALDGLGFTRAVEALDSRSCTEGGSQSLSGASLAWALALRYGARGNEPMNRLQRQFPSWGARAGALGYLIAVDLVLAEIHAAHDHVTADGSPPGTGLDCQSGRGHEPA